MEFKTNGKIILYLGKDSSYRNLSYGSRLVINKPLQEIKNSGNPGGFDYKRYSLFHGITHQVFLTRKDYEILPELNRSRFQQFINTIRAGVLKILRKNIDGVKESGLAEALLIGYKDDLDKTLVQSYSNTGVVHVIAISGLHLGLIYWLLIQLFSPLKKYQRMKWIRPLLILAGLWLFSLLAGAQPSVIRSAVMFSCIVIGQSFERKSSIYNTLAFSAFILLCVNPYWLWDVGFQLSYAAVFSIVIFMRPIYNWFYIKNKALDFLWKLNAVTLAAQVFTLPVSIYHFHQYPNYFLLTNFLAVPLSSLILLGEIFLCMIAFVPALALLTGKVLSWLIYFMNSYIERIERLPFSLKDGLEISIFQTVLLILTAAACGYWLLEKYKNGLKIALLSCSFFLLLRMYAFTEAGSQDMMIVYNVPQKRAVDFIHGRKFIFYGDDELKDDNFSRNFHLKPSRIKYRAKEADLINNYSHSGNLFQFIDKKILLLDTSAYFTPVDSQITLDLLIISRIQKLDIKFLVNNYQIKQVIIDGTVSPWKSRNWKKEFDDLRIACHEVSEKGAFVMKLR